MTDQLRTEYNEAIDALASALDALDAACEANDEAARWEDVAQRDNRAVAEGRTRAWVARLLMAEAEQVVEAAAKNAKTACLAVARGHR